MLHKAIIKYVNGYGKAAAVRKHEYAKAVRKKTNMERQQYGRRPWKIYILTKPPLFITYLDNGSFIMVHLAHKNKHVSPDLVSPYCTLLSPYFRLL